MHVGRDVASLLGNELPVLAAPMAGGATTSGLVEATGRAGSLGFIPAGYRTVEALDASIEVARGLGVPFGVNLFAPSPVPIDEDSFAAYARAIQPEASAYDLDLSQVPRRQDDDQWSEKLDLLLSHPVAAVSFTFSAPSTSIVRSLTRSGTVVIQTVTSTAEAVAAFEAGVDCLMVQAAAAGGHSATFSPRTLPREVPLPELLGRIRAAVPLPMIGAGGIGTPVDVHAALRAGAGAVAVGTALLRAPESGASELHKAALVDPAFEGTVLTRAFTGRPARALRNRFTERYSESAPAGYPAIHHLTSALRRAAVAAGDGGAVNLWAGTGHRRATTEPAAVILQRLSE